MLPHHPTVFLIQNNQISRISRRFDATEEENPHFQPELCELETDTPRREVQLSVSGQQVETFV